MTVTTLFSDDAQVVDGYVRQTGAGVTWTTLATGAGDDSNSAATTLRPAVRTENSTADRWDNISRAIIGFDTETIANEDLVTAAILSVYGSTKGNSAGAISTNVFSAAPASETALANGDYNSLGSAVMSSALEHNAWSTSGYNDFTLNSVGLPYITFTDQTFFGMADPVNDIPDSAPAHVGGSPDSFVLGWSAEEDQAGDRRPKIAITHVDITTATPAWQNQSTTLMPIVAAQDRFGRTANLPYFSLALFANIHFGPNASGDFAEPSSFEIIVKPGEFEIRKPL